MTPNTNRNKRIFQGALLLGAFLGVLLFARLWQNLVTPAVENFFHPYLELPRRAAAKLSDHTLLLRSRTDLAAEIETLRRRNRELLLQAGTANELWAENADLRRQLDLTPPRHWRFLAAEITLRDPGNWNGRFILNRGERDGVTPGAAVAEVDPDGRRLLAGVVGGVFKRSCEVIPIGNPALRLAVRIGENGEIGFLNAGERRPEPGRIPVGFLPPDFSASPGAAVLTAGFEEKIPPGLKVGELAAIDASEGVFSTRLSVSGVVAAAARPNRERLLFIALREPPRS